MASISGGPDGMILGRVWRWLSWWWSTRRCEHPRVQRIGGDARQYGYRFLCVRCGRVLREVDATTEVR